MTFAAVDWGEVLRFDTPVLEIAARGSAVYLFLFLLLRLVLKRQSGSLGVTDLLVLVLIADAAQNAMADDYRSVPDGLVLVSVIVFWAWFLDWLGFHVPFMERLLKPRKLPLVRDGRVLVANLRRELVTREELHSQLREQGVDDIGKVRAAFMEPNGQISVITIDDGQKPVRHEVTT